MPGIDPLQPPYDAEAGEQLGAMMPPGTPPIAPSRALALAGDVRNCCKWGRWSASGYRGRGDQAAGGAPARLGSSPDVRASAGRRSRGNGGFAGNSPESRAVPGGPSVKACHTPPRQTAPWPAPSASRDVAVHAVSCAPNPGGAKGVR